MSRSAEPSVLRASRPDLQRRTATPGDSSILVHRGRTRQLRPGELKRLLQGHGAIRRPSRDLGSSDLVRLPFTRPG